MIEQQGLHVIYVRLQDCCPLLIQCESLVGLMLLRRKVRLFRTKPDRSEGYDERDQKLRNQIHQIPQRLAAQPPPGSTKKS
jgi:hypothetical protein